MVRLYIAVSYYSSYYSLLLSVTVAWSHAKPFFNARLWRAKKKKVVRRNIKEKVVWLARLTVAMQ